MELELAESEATGRIADIYGDIRRLWAVGYVSSLQRHLAARAGWLEWAWAALAPAFESGAAQTAGWRAADGLDLPTFPAMPRAELARLGVGPEDERIIAATCAAFVRVAPVNLMFAGLLRRLLQGGQSTGAGWPDRSWQAPAALAEPPAMVDPDTAGPEVRATMMRLSTPHGDTPFVPGLYRILAHWPAFLDTLSVALPPLLDSPDSVAARRQLLAQLDGAVETVFTRLPAAPPMPGEDDVDEILAALDTYRLTSPEMVIAGRIVAATLPGNAT